MDDWLRVDFSDSREDSILQLLDGGDADVFEKGSRHLAKQCFGDVQPRSMRGSENVPEPVGVFGQITAGLFGEMSGVVVEDDSDDAFGRIVRVQILLSREPTASAVSLQTERSRHSSAQAHSDSPVMLSRPRRS